MKPLRLLIDWKGLKELGWPYSRTNTWRMMEDGRFPRAYKLGKHPNSHPVWLVADVLRAFQTFGIPASLDMLSR